MLLKVGDLDPNLASSGKSVLCLSQHSADGKECSAHSITSAWLSLLYLTEPALGRSGLFGLMVSRGFIHHSGEGTVEQLRSKQWESVSKLTHIALDQETERVQEELAAR